MAKRLLHALGTALVVAGLLALAWSLVTWRWQDPVSGLYTRYEQHVLARHLSDRDAATPAAQPTAAAIAAAARRYRLATRPGDAIGRLLVPRLGLNIVVVEGTDAASLRRGPGRDPRSLMPGERGLVYIAGHRTTFLAPFSHIDAMRRGDRVTLEMPYATIVYAVTGHEIVAARDLSVLRARRSELLALQACHPRFFATERYIVWARPVSAVTRDGRTVRLGVTVR